MHTTPDQKIEDQIKQVRLSTRNRTIHMNQFISTDYSLRLLRNASVMNLVVFLRLVFYLFTKGLDTQAI